MKTLSSTQLLSLLRDKSKHQFITLTHAADVKFKKPSECPFTGRVLKIQKLYGTINFNYEGAVKREVDSDFIAGPRPWGTRVPNCPVIAHKKGQEGALNFYLEMRVLDNLETTYYLDGEKVTPDQMEEIQKWFKPERETEVELKTLKLESIREIQIGGETISVESVT